MAAVAGLAWKGRRVLVTGADGFIGSHLCERLLALGARVSVLVRARSVTGTTQLILRNLSRVQERLERTLAMDVAGADVVHKIRELAPSCIFHLAAEAYVERSFTQPREVLRTNLEGTMNVLEAARQCEAVSRVVVTSSSEVYGPAQCTAIAEDHPLEPTSPYAASKVSADRMAMAYHRTYGLDVAVIRPFNTFGPRHIYDVIPKFIALALRGEPLLLFGGGEQSRDFTYVDDMVEAFVRMGQADAARGRVVNFGTGVATSVAEIARAVVQCTGSSSPIKPAPARAAEVARLCCDATLAKELLGWTANISLREGLQRNVQWFLDRQVGA